MTITRHGRPVARLGRVRAGHRRDRADRFDAVGRFITNNRRDFDVGIAEVAVVFPEELPEPG